MTISPVSLQSGQRATDLDVMEASRGLAVVLAAILGAGVGAVVVHDRPGPTRPQPVSVTTASAAVEPSTNRGPVVAHVAQPRRVPAANHHATPPPRTVRAPSRPKARATSAPRRVHTAARPAPAGPTSWPALNAAIARIPTYRAGGARWVVHDTGYWGTADWDHNIIYISPSVPSNRLYDVAVHEWSHILSVRDYGGDVAHAVHAMTAYFGGTGLSGAEDAADCMAILQGASWTHYTNCSSARWRAGAQQLVDGARLP